VTAIEANGKSYKLEFTINALCALEEKSGCDSIDELFSSGKISLTRIRLLIWSGLLEDKPDISVKEAGEIMGSFLKQEDGLEKLTTVLNEAVMAALPQAKKARPMKGK